MIRPTKYVKLLLHTVYLICFLYFVTQRSYKITKVILIDRFEKDIKHILVWTKLQGVSHEGQKSFVLDECEDYNCYITKNRTLFKDIRYFDAIIFDVQQVSAEANDLPKLRGGNQKYIFAAKDSADNFPVCDPAYDAFFNWTWTYRTDSTIPYQFISVQTMQRQKLTAQAIQWRNIKTTDIFLMKQLATKNKAAATFLDKCDSRSNRTVLLKGLQEELAKYNLTLDIYGDCGSMKCRRRSMGPCNYRLRKDYYFYLAVEESIAVDYITDIVLHAYKNNVVPVVYGGAKYKRFLPRDSYLDVSQFSNLSALAETMHQVISNKQKYYDMFSWKQYYIIEKEHPLDICALCQELNSPRKIVHHFSYPEFRKWWNPMFKIFYVVVHIGS